VPFARRARLSTERECCSLADIDFLLFFGLVVFIHDADVVNAVRFSGNFYPAMISGIDLAVRYLASPLRSTVGLGEDVLDRKLRLVVDVYTRLQRRLRLYGTTYQ